MSQKALHDMQARIDELEKALAWLCNSCDWHVKDVDVCVQISAAYENARQLLGESDSVLGGEQRPTEAGVTPECPIKLERGES